MSLAFCQFLFVTEFDFEISFVKMAFLKALLDNYFEATSVHGFSYVHSRNHGIARLIWVNKMFYY